MEENGIIFQLPYGELIFFSIFLFLVVIGIWGYRHQKRWHRRLAKKMLRETEASALVVDFSIWYEGLASRGILQPHGLRGVLVISKDLIHLVVPAGDFMSNLELKIPVSKIKKLLYSDQFVYPGSKMPDLLILVFEQDGKTEELALRPSDRERTIKALEKITGICFVKR